MAWVENCVYMLCVTYDTFCKAERKQEMEEGKEKEDSRIRLLTIL